MDRYRLLEFGHRRSGGRTLSLDRRSGGFDALNMGATIIMVLLWLGSLCYEERGDGTDTDEENGACEGKCLIYQIVVAQCRKIRPQQRRLDSSSSTSRR